MYVAHVCLKNSTANYKGIPILPFKTKVNALCSPFKPRSNEWNIVRTFGDYFFLFIVRSSVAMSIEDKYCIGKIIVDNYCIGTIIV